MPTNTLGLVTIWAGPLPAYLPLFLLTAGRNATVEFVFICDQPAPDRPLPSNVRWVHRSVEAMVDQIGERLGLVLELEGAYKLIDFKPAFGVALADDLVGFDFWGHVDCDLVLGDLRSFATDAVLDANDLVMFRGREFVHGPLTLYRNCDRINRLFERAPDWKDTFTDPRPRSFTEQAHRDRIRTSALAPQERMARAERVSMTDVAFHAAAVGEIRLHDQDHVNESPPDRFPVALRYDDGHLFDEALVREHYRRRALVVRPQLRPREVAYFHLLFAKQDDRFVVPDWPALPRRFVIRRMGITDDPTLTWRYKVSNTLSSAAPYVRARARGRYRDARKGARRIRRSIAGR
jgi:hypothetical protein